MSNPLSPDGEIAIPDMAQRLADVPLFEQMDADELAYLASHATVQNVTPGAILSDQNTTEHDLFIVIRGHLEVWLDPATIGGTGAQHKLATLFADEIAGELALVDGGVRSARLKAGEEGASVLKIAQNAILSQCDANPAFGYKLMRNLAAMLALRNRLTALSVQTPPL